jgi:hypothetical protein
MEYERAQKRRHTVTPVAEHTNLQCLSRVYVPVVHLLNSHLDALGLPLIASLEAPSRGSDLGERGWISLDSELVHYFSEDAQGCLITVRL